MPPILRSSSKRHSQRAISPLSTASSLSSPSSSPTITPYALPSTHLPSSSLKRKRPSTSSSTSSLSSEASSTSSESRYTLSTHMLWPSQLCRPDEGKLERPFQQERKVESKRIKLTTTAAAGTQSWDMGGYLELLMTERTSLQNTPAASEVGGSSRRGSPT